MRTTTSPTPAGTAHDANPSSLASLTFPAVLKAVCAQGVGGRATRGSTP